MKLLKILFAALLFLVLSCEKKYERPAKYKVDLFKNERNNPNKPFVYSEEEAFQESRLVLASSDLKITDSSKNGKPYYIYEINSGEILKADQDTVINCPFSFLSQTKLNLTPKKQDSVYVYLEKIKGYQKLVEERKLNYQWLKSAPLAFFKN